MASVSKPSIEVTTRGFVRAWGDAYKNIDLISV
jgi:hypothetical protein